MRLPKPPQGPRRWALLAALVAAPLALPAAAADAQALRLRAMAATCAQCHGTDGHAVEGATMTRLAGKPRTELADALLAFRAGEKPATVMHQIAKGFTPEQLQALATYFSQQK